MGVLLPESGPGCRIWQMELNSQSQLAKKTKIKTITKQDVDKLTADNRLMEAHTP